MLHATDFRNLSDTAGSPTPNIWRTFGAMGMEGLTWLRDERGLVVGTQSQTQHDWRDMVETLVIEFAHAIAADAYHLPLPHTHRPSQFKQAPKICTPYLDIKRYTASWSLMHDDKLTANELRFIPTDALKRVLIEPRIANYLDTIQDYVTRCDNTLRAIPSAPVLG